MEVRDPEERHTLVIRTSTPVGKLSEVMGSSYCEIMQTMGSSGVQPTGPPFAMYHNMDVSNLDVEIGFPVAEKTEEAYNRLTAFVKEQGLEPESYVYEFYLNDPAETPPEELKTEIYFPVKG